MLLLSKNIKLKSEKSKWVLHSSFFALHFLYLIQTVFSPTRFTSTSLIVVVG
ncbi:unknown [Prevotella sp. CAG:1124]|nr:unknown [Prevotella sp. CAG:1124]